MCIRDSPANDIQYSYVIDDTFENLQDDVADGYGWCAEPLNEAMPEEGVARTWDVGDPLDMVETFGSCNVCGWTPYESDIVINEIHYNPCSNQGDDFEWEFCELLNLGDLPADISGFNFINGASGEDQVGLVFPEGTTMGPGEFLSLIHI